MPFWPLKIRSIAHTAYWQSKDPFAYHDTKYSGSVDLDLLTDQFYGSF